MGRYSKMLGIAEIKVKDETFKITPKAGDNLELMDVMSKAQDGNTSIAFKGFKDWMVKILKRDCPPEDEQDAEALEVFVEQNIVELLNKVMVEFNWASEDDIKKGVAHPSVQALRKDVKSS